MSIDKMHIKFGKIKILPNLGEAFLKKGTKPSPIAAELVLRLIFMIFYDLSKHSAQRFADAANRNGL